MIEKTLVYSVDRYIGKRKADAGGLADRLKGVVFCYFLAKLTGRRFFIDWSSPFALSEVFGFKDLDWSFDGFNGDDVHTIDLVDKRFTDERKKLLSSGPEGIEELFSEHHLVKIHCNSMPIQIFDRHDKIDSQFLPLLESERVFFFRLFNELFRYAVPSELASQYQEFLRIKRENGYVVGLQFRTGGDGKWRDPTMDDPENVTDLLRVAQSLLLKNSIENHAFYLTTDSGVAKEKLISIVCNDAELMFSDSDPVHIERSEADVARAGAVQTCFEHFLLSQCDIIVCGKGGFGRTSAYREGKEPFRYYQMSSTSRPVPYSSIYQ